MPKRRGGYHGPDEFEQLLEACPEYHFDAFVFCERLLRKLKRWRNRGIATDEDVADAEAGREAVRRVLVRRHWPTQ